MTEPRQLNLKNDTLVTVLQTHVVEIQQGEQTVILGAEELMQILLALKEPDAPEPPSISLG
jgi:hypothetical protein